MSRLPAFFGARKGEDESRKDDLRKDELRDGDSSALAKVEPISHDDVFDLLPPETPAGVEKDRVADTPAPPEPVPADRNVHPVALSDLSRLSIDNDGRLYWDGKPVEVSRRIMMSRAQVIGAGVIGTFVVIGAVAAAIQGSAAARDWACRLGWTTSYCTLPDAGPARPRTDIPA